MYKNEQIGIKLFITLEVLIAISPDIWLLGQIWKARGDEREGGDSDGGLGTS